MKEKMYARPRRLWVVAGLAGLSVMAAIGFCRVESSGTKAGLIQFDAINEVNTDQGYTDWVVFARYWVCRDYYAGSVVWSEPHGKGMYNLGTLVVLSDRNSFRMNDEKYAYWVPANTTYPKPFGDRGPFRHAGGFYACAEMRFAEAEALARRVRVSDLGPPKDSNIVDVKVPQSADGTKRKLARVKAQVKGDRIESMELFDAQQTSLGRMKYEYEQKGDPSPLVKLVAELPVRPEKLAANVQLKNTSPAGGKKTYRFTDVDYVYHKGGRTCTVTYKDVTIGDKAVRLPVQVEVRVSDSKRLLRSARLMNFKRVDLDKAGVWEAAKAFADMSSEDRAYDRLVKKYINPDRELGPMKVDPNDLVFVRRLIAKYPVLEMPPMPRQSRAEPPMKQGASELSREARMEQARKQTEARKQAQAQWHEQVARTPKPQRMDIEPNDLRVIRQLVAHYGKEQLLALKKDGGTPTNPVTHIASESERERSRLRTKLRDILEYHRVPLLPEDQPPELEPKDRELVRQLREHYEKLAREQDRGLGGRLKAMDALTQLDRILKDYDAFEAHTTRHLQMVREAGLPAIYMVGAHRNLEAYVVAGQCEKANQLLYQWAERSAAENEADAVFRFAGWDVEGSKRDPWASVQLLDQFLKKPGLPPVQRYEGLALRGIALHKVDRLLSDPETVENELRKAQAQWILSTTNKAEVAKRVEPALREALSAWQSLGSAKTSEAKPYSTDDVPSLTKNLMGYPEATKLQETSALLNSIIRERTGQKGARQPTPSR